VRRRLTDTGYDLFDAPGHLIRRAQQAHVELWGQVVGTGLTGPQFAVLHTLSTHRTLDQTRLAAVAGLDTSTCQDVVARLQGKGLLARQRDPGDRRRWLLTLTPKGRRVLTGALPGVIAVGERLLEPLTAEEGAALVRLLAKLVRARAADTVNGTSETDSGIR
jgi:DNA-binding MarR family transcriptional regulator